jgi:cytochrome c556
MEVLMMLRKVCLTILVVVCVPQSADSQPNSQYELVQLVAERRTLMYDMQTAYLSLLAIKQGERTDLASAADDARSINDKIGKFVELLMPGTAAGQVSNSRAKPEIWTQRDEFFAAVEALGTTSAMLVETANTGDINAFNEQFEAFTEACLGCHGLRPSSDGRFRSAPK